MWLSVYKGYFKKNNGSVCLGIIGFMKNNYLAFFISRLFQTFLFLVKPKMVTMHIHHTVYNTQNIISNTGPKLNKIERVVSIHLFFNVSGSSSGRV